MSKEPRVAADYAPGCSELVRRTCLEVATRLGDFRGQMCVVGSLVPSLIIDQARRGAGVEEHIGTIDLDLGLSIVVLNDQLYEEIAKRLREAKRARDLTGALDALPDLSLSENQHAAAAATGTDDASPVVDKRRLQHQRQHSAHKTAPTDAKHAASPKTQPMNVTTRYLQHLGRAHK